MLARRASLWLVAAIGAGAAVAFAWNWSASSYRPILRSDPLGYAAYLPATVVEHDPSLRTLAAHHYGDDSVALRTDGLDRDPSTGEVVDKYGAGVAVAELPMFLVGHEVAVAGGVPADGYSNAEQGFTAFSGVLAGILGLLFLRALLLRVFTPGVALAALACTCLGTSLFDYMGYDSGFSHSFSFAAVGATALAAVRWRERPNSLARALATGAAAGFVVLLRPSNAVAVAPLVLLGVTSREALIGRMHAGWSHRRELLGAVVAAVGVFAPQLLLWHAETGRWLISPYPADEGFSPLHPNLGALFSWDPHGLLPYAPVLVLVVPGLVLLWRSHREWFWPAAVGLGAQAYVIATWHAWWFGHAFGQRGFVDVAAYFGIALAACFAALRAPLARFAVGGLAAALTATTVLGLIAYWRGRIPLDGIDAAGYVRAILG